MSRVWTGSIVGTGSAINCRKLGFRPKKVKLFNAASGGLCSLEWNSAMPDASGFKVKPHDTAQTAFITSGGVTPLASGFTLGADADMNAAGEVVYIEAMD